MCQIIGLGFLVRQSTPETGFPPGGLEWGRESRPVTTSQQTKGTENTKLLRIQMDLGKQIKNPISVGILFQASLLPLDPTSRDKKKSSNLSGRNWLQIDPNGYKCGQMAPICTKWLQMAPTGSKWLHMASNCSKWLQMSPNH